MIRPCNEADFETMLLVINDSAQAYRGVIPPDRYHIPYMTADYLRAEIDSGVMFYGYDKENNLLGVMGIQHVRDVTLLRHAYVLTEKRGCGIGSELLQFLVQRTERPTLIGTWSAAVWAVRFYEKHGFTLVTEEEKNRLLTAYWSLPDRQVETSVVLADNRYFSSMRSK
ncbi:MAG: GNAT family N-acetyltransferase [Spirochaetae bacterium HGW-Spirochaetae-1]|jgi:GNAT superfamily N-acetyltransferase|nr:MAG: GNAT family N-acetyltransferase [Spirochaetae bacterium HGW-Spirochaetae-1]